MPSSPQLHVSLTPELHAFIRERLEAGLSATESDVVREGLQLLQQHERESIEIESRLRTKLKRASDQADRGEFVSGDAAFARLDAIIAKHRSAGSAT